LTKAKTIPSNRKLYRVHWSYRSEDDGFKVSTSGLLTEDDANALARELASAAQTNPNRKPYVRADARAVAEFEDERELRRKGNR
jgi:hypothetical protein